MRFPVGMMLLVAAPLFAQGPYQSVEPPLADPALIPAVGTHDPDESDEVRPVQHIVPAPIPGGMRTAPVVVPAGPVAGGELPTPAVSLDVEGSEVTATGQPVVFKLYVRNTSRARAHNVVVKVIPPKGAEKVKAEPPPSHDEAETRWELKTLEPGQSRVIELAYKPAAGATEIKLQARVQFDFGRGMITKVATPTLSVKKEAPETMVVGDTETCRITITNPGQVTVRDIEVREILGKQLAYADRELSRGMVDGRLTSSVDEKNGERTWSIPAIAPGKTEVIEYKVKARDSGRLTSTVLVKAPQVDQKKESETEVLTAQLQLHAEGPASAKGTVGQPAVYKITVKNEGSADLKNVAVGCVVPPDMRATRATSGGQPIRDGVQWVFRVLKKGESQELTVNLVTTSPGTRTVRFTARAHRGAEQRQLVKTTFAGVPSLDWDVEGPGVGTVGKSVTYRVTIANRGTADGKAWLRVDLLGNLDRKSTNPASTSGTGAAANEREIRFAETPFPAGKKTTYTIVVAPREAGEAKLIFTLFEQGRSDADRRLDKVLNVVAGDSRSPTGPPPAGGVDRTKVGMAPRP